MIAIGEYFLPEFLSQISCKSFRPVEMSSDFSENETNMPIYKEPFGPGTHKLNRWPEVLSMPPLESIQNICFDRILSEIVAIIRGVHQAIIKLPSTSQ